MSHENSWLSRLVKIEPEEGPAVFYSFLYFFCLMSGYYVIRPVRDAVGVAGGDAHLRLLYIGTLVCTLLLSPIFSSLVSRFSRRIFVPWSYHLLTLNLLGFYFLFRAHPQQPPLWLNTTFFLWTSVYNLFAVSVFWGFMADLFRSEQAKRLFGFIGLAGTLGAILGAGVTSQLAERLGTFNLLLVAAALLQLSVLAINRLNSMFETQAGGQAEKPPGRGALSGIKTVFQSPYLLGICLFMFLYTLTSSLLYFEQARIVRESVTDTAQRTAIFAKIDLYVNGITAFTQAFLSARIVTWLGTGRSMMLLPLVTLVSYTWLSVAPALGILIFFQTLRRAVEYSVVRPCREMLFTVLPREEKYCAKNFIDTFVYRGGDLVGAYTDQVLKAMTLTAVQLNFALGPVTIGWMVLAYYLGRHQTKLARARGEEP